MASQSPRFSSFAAFKKFFLRIPYDPKPAVVAHQVSLKIERLAPLMREVMTAESIIEAQDFIGSKFKIDETRYCSILRYLELPHTTFDDLRFCYLLWFDGQLPRSLNYLAPMVVGEDLKIVPLLRAINAKGVVTLDSQTYKKTKALVQMPYIVGVCTLTTLKRLLRRVAPGCTVYNSVQHPDIDVVLTLANGKPVTRQRGWEKLQSIFREVPTLSKRLDASGDIAQVLLVSKTNKLFQNVVDAL